MKYFPLATLFSLAILSSCSCGPGGETTDTDSETGDEVSKPFQDEWETIVENHPFPISGEDNIGSITIGRESPYEDNFANRGDVFVYFDQDQEVITIRMRRYTFGREGEKEDIFANLKPWAYETTSNPRQPDKETNANCLEGTWRDGCTLLVYYEGLVQPVRTGADLEVHLPREYRGRITINTNDNDAESTYLLRGDVNVLDLRGSATINANNGNVNVRFSEELTSAPSCTSEQIDKCQKEKWDKECGCSSFGTTNVTTRAGNITLDIPTDIWITTFLDNEDQQSASGSDVCVATVENCGENCTIDQDLEQSPWKAQVEYNYPGEPAPQGGGYRIDAIPEQCEIVSFVNEPGDVGKELEELRGSTRICSNCLDNL